MATETETKTRQIMFSSSMVRAILDGKKTQTRRVMKTQPPNDATELKIEGGYTGGIVTYRAYPGGGSARWGICDSKYEIGDLLYVREVWHVGAGWDHLKGSDLPHDIEIKYGPPKHKSNGRYRHSRFMPRWASRLTLEIIDVRVQRLNEISEEDAMAEGVDISCKYIGGKCNSARCAEHHYRNGFAALWDSLNGKTFPWASNPWVWALTFKVVA